MFQETGQSIAGNTLDKIKGNIREERETSPELPSEDQVESLLVELAGLVVLRDDELGLVGRGAGQGDGGRGERVVGGPLAIAGLTCAVEVILT